MSGFNFTLPNGQAFEIKGPPGLTKEQAQTIFDLQAKTGALVGFKPGDVLSSATQAADGLASAQSQVGQALSGITGALGAGIAGAAGAIGKVSSALGAAGGALNGSLAGISAGLTGAVGPAVSSFTGAITGAAGQIGSVATQAINTINTAITGTAVTLPIEVANFVKQIPALTPIANMSSTDVTAVMAQAKNLVGQGVDVLSNVKGVGSFGLDVQQLETAGILKPGTSALATSAGSTISAMLKSPAVYTGKDGIKDVQSLLASAPKQAEIQQTLMAKGLVDLAAVGIPIDKLSAQGVAGVALSAAKDVLNTENLLKGLPVPADAKAAFDTAVRDGAYAVNLAETKVPAVFKAIDFPVPAEDTVNRETLDAATTRILGNDKIPEPNYGPSTINSLSDDAFADKFSVLYAAVLNGIVNPTGRIYQAVESKLSALESRQNITRAQWEAINSEFVAAKNNYDNQAPTALADLYSFVESGTAKQQRVLENPVSGLNKLQNLVQYLIETGSDIKERLRLLAGDIQG
jgi:hypothetical protein